MQRFDAHFKVDPPLRSRKHLDSLIAGLRDGTIDAITSDHRPLAAEKKQIELDLAPFGVNALETVLPICATHLVHAGHLSWSELISKLTIGPARILGIPAGTLGQGTIADVTIIDPAADWQIDVNQFQSRSRNSPFDGAVVRGRVESVWVNGQQVLKQGQVISPGPRMPRTR